MKKISVVIIAKNEEKNIGMCLESILQSEDQSLIHEIVLIDSVSCDQTVEIAKRYPVRIIQLDFDFFISPAAGRFIGLKNTTGDFIYFLDGDMKLDGKWFKIALPIIESNSNIAGVAGICHDMIFDNKFIEIKNENKDRYNVGCVASKVKHLGGSALYRRTALEKTGGFNPYLANEEELELGLRLSAAGYILQRIPVPMTIHYTKYYSNENPSGLTIRQIKRDFTLGRYISLGKVLYLLWKNPFLLEYIYLYRTSMIFVGIYLTGLMSVFNISYFLLWLSASTVLFFARVLIKRSLSDTILYLIDHSLSAYGFIAGLLKPAPRIETYQPCLKFIK